MVGTANVHASSHYMFRFLRATPFKRFNSSLNENEVAKARQWLDSYSHTDIPKENFVISFSRASGPGGQKVNKTSSKATVSLEPYQWLNQKHCDWIPSLLVLQLVKNPIRYQTKSGGILIQSDMSRNRDDNQDECFRKLLQEIKACVYIETPVSDVDKKKWERIKLVLNERRIEAKKKQSDKKKGRSKNFDF